MGAMRLTLIDCLDLLPDDFTMDRRKTIASPLNVDVVALVQVKDSDLDAEILSIRSGLEELIGDVKSDALWKVKEAVRRMYWLESMSGREGDAVVSEGDHG